MLLIHSSLSLSGERGDAAPSPAADAWARDNVCGAAIKVTTNKKQHSAFFTACCCAFLTAVITGGVWETARREGGADTHCGRAEGGTSSVKRQI